MEQLRRIAFRQDLADAEPLGLASLRQIGGPEDEVPQGKLAGEVPIPGLPVPAVMPAVEVRRSDQPVERAEAEPQVRVKQYRMPVIDDCEDADRPFGKAEREAG